MCDLKMDEEPLLMMCGVDMAKGDGEEDTLFPTTDGRDGGGSPPPIPPLDPLLPSGVWDLLIFPVPDKEEEEDLLRWHGEADLLLLDFLINK